MKLFKILMVSYVFCNLVCFASQASQVQVTPVFNIGVEFGGDDVAELSYTDGSTSTLSAGRGFVLSAGALFDLDVLGGGPHVLQIQPTFGTKIGGTSSAKNGSLTWWRFPLELMTFYSNKDYHFRIGAGLTDHLWNGIHGSGVVDKFGHNFNSSLGYVIAGDYIVNTSSNQRILIGLKYTGISYTSSTNSGFNVNANSFGLSVGFAL